MTLNGTIAYYNRNAEAFCQATRDADMGFCRERFLRLVEQKRSIGDGVADEKWKIHILDAGCGSGRDGKAFSDAGYIVTAVDGSIKMCEEAEKLLRQKVFCIRLEELEFDREFDGIWACASLLHISYEEIRDVLKRLWNALKEEGIFYASFKYGEGKRVDGDRVFYDYREEQLKELMESSYFSIEDLFVTQDVREDRRNEKWVNVLAKKESFPS